jgi:hypothetical protein
MHLPQICTEPSISHNLTKNQYFIKHKTKNKEQHP